MASIPDSATRAADLAVVLQRLDAAIVAKRPRLIRWYRDTLRRHRPQERQHRVQARKDTRRLRAVA